jgi:hypothetical protein
MIYAKKIHMNIGCQNSSYLTDIDTIYLEGTDNDKFYKKAIVHDYVKKTPNSIKVNIPPFPYLIPAISTNGEKYVRSEPNDSVHDNLLKLPRE